MNAKKLLTAAAVAAALSSAGLGAAHASTKTEAISFVGDVATFADLTVTGSDFTDYFTFALPASYDLSSTVTSGFIKVNKVKTDRISFTEFNLYSGTVGTGSLVASGALTDPSSSEWSLDVANLTAKQYYLQVTGKTTDGLSGNYSGNINLIASVPEPESYAMLLAGLGLMGTIARRRSKAKAS